MEALPETSVGGLQVTDDTNGTTTVPPVAVTVIGLPFTEVASALVMPIGAPVVLADSVTVMTAITPFWITFPFTPSARHVRVPETPPHRIDLPAALAAGPALDFIKATAAAG